MCSEVKEMYHSNLSDCSVPEMLKYHLSKINHLYPTLCAPLLIRIVMYAIVLPLTAQLIGSHLEKWLFLTGDGVHASYEF